MEPGRTSAHRGSPDIADVGVVGLGVMGARIASHLAEEGLLVVGFDVAGVAPSEVESCASLEELVARAPTVLLSLPHAAAVSAVARGIRGADPCRVDLVVDLSTIGVEGARAADAILAPAGIAYVDSPVSGGRHAAATGELSLMVGARAEELDRAAALLGMVGRSVVHVGESPGHGQAMKVINNAISGTTLAVTSEALAVGCALGLDLPRMLAVVNASSGRSVASERKFPDQVVTGRYAHGGPGAHFDKDIGLFLELAASTAVDHRVAAASAALWKSFDEQAPGADQTRLFPHLLQGWVPPTPGAPEGDQPR